MPMRGKVALGRGRSRGRRGSRAAKHRGFGGKAPLSRNGARPNGALVAAPLAGKCWPCEGGFGQGSGASGRRTGGSRRPLRRRRDRALEAGHPPRRDRASLPAADRARQRPHRRGRGAGPLERRRKPRGAVRPRRSRRPGRAAVARRSSARRCAPPAAGAGRSPTCACRSTCCRATSTGPAMSNGCWPRSPRRA